MLDIKFIRENKESVKKNNIDRGLALDIERLLNLDKHRRGLIQETEALRSQQNKAGGEIMEQGNEQARQEKIADMRGVKEKLSRLQTELEKVENEYKSIMMAVPNMIQPDVPVGRSADDNVVLREVGKKRKIIKPFDYLELAQKLDLIDVERAAKVSGSRFGYIKKELAILEFALVKLALDVLGKEKFKPIVPPVMIKSHAMQAMGYIDTVEDRAERYFIAEDDLYFVGTSEQAVGPMHMNEVLDEKDLPLRYAAFSTCFRREAGSYGKDTKGILRVHQFDKVEMFSFCRPEASNEEHQLMLSLEEKLMQKLDLPYRVVRLCSVDFARPSSATIDIETWLPGQKNGEGQYRETHSTSNCTDFQARRLNIKFKDQKTGKTELVHTLNGTAFAIGRTLIAIIENYQQKDGSVEVPKVLRDWCGFKKIKK